MGKDYRKYTDWKLKQEHERHWSNGLEREMNRRGLLEEEEEDDFEEKEEQNDDESGGSFSGVIVLIVIAMIIGFFINPQGTWKVIKFVGMFILYGIMKLIQMIFY